MYKLSVKRIAAIVCLAIFTLYFLDKYNHSSAPASRLPSSLAMSIMYANIPDEELKIAATVNPNYCRLKPSIIKDEWDASCENVPMHRYQKILTCSRPNFGGFTNCHDAEPGITDCRSFYLSIDSNGSTHNRITPDGPMASISAPCIYISLEEEDDSKMKQLGLSKTLYRRFVHAN